MTGATAGDAHLTSRSARRQQWWHASALIAQRLLTTGDGDALDLIAARVHDLAAADLVTVVVPDADPRRLRVAVATGGFAPRLVGTTYDRNGSLVACALDRQVPLALTDAKAGARPWHQSAVLGLGPVMVLPLRGGARPRGALGVSRIQGAAPFDEVDLEMAGAFADQVALALELADARGHQVRAELLEDRDRIARDLHDHVIQRLFAVGLSVESVLGRVDDGEVAARLSTVVDDLDTTIAQIRTTVFELRDPASGGREVRRQVLDVVAEVASWLSARPEVRFHGPIDTVVAEDVLHDIVAVVREGLTNVRRHAGAARVDVSLAADAGHVVLVVEDDGAGMGTTTRRSGLENLRVRAERRHGRLEVTSVDPSTGKGTRLTWSIALM